jgi:hypothetical protein
MNKAILAIILGLGISSAAHAAQHTVPSAESCVSDNGSAHRITNICGYGIEVQVRWSDDSNDLEELGPGRSADTTDFGANTTKAVRWFACPNPAYVTTQPGSVSPPHYSTQTFWCQVN